MTFAREPVRAPALTGREWLNTAMPLSWADLRGKLVLLDFWTYGCINCQHVLDELRAIEAEFAGAPLAVIGIHSAKFANEQDADHIRAAIGRLDIRHPVLVDEQMALWNAFAVRGWPTLVLVDPQGYLLGQVAGEGNGPRLAAAIRSALDLLRTDTGADSAPLPVRLEANVPAWGAGTAAPPTPLRYPGKVLADVAHDRLYIADTGYHRVVVTTLAGELVDTIGAGEPGHADGDFAAATLAGPQGLALVGDALFIADTANHRIRRADLTARTVTTVAGTGAQNRRRAPVGPALAVALNSPWDLALDGDTLWIAMAGQHQLWALDLAAGTVRVATGSGGEGRQDGPAHAATLAQPSGLALDDRAATLFFADSESSSVRALDLAADVVTTVAGGDLFDFGRRDGVGNAARFQHPLGVAWHAGALYVADTYNHALRRVDPATGAVTTVAGDGTAGFADGRGAAARCFEPGGIASGGDRLYIADTNNHAVRVLDPRSGDLTTLALRDVCPPGLCLP